MSLRRYCTYCITKGDIEIQEIVKNLELHKDFVQDLGTFTAQRPSTAACKAYTQLRRKSKLASLEPPHNLKYIFVKLELSNKSGHLFEVEYIQSTDPFLGQITRPCAKILVNTTNSDMII